MTQHGNELSLPYCERDALERELRPEPSMVGYAYFIFCASIT